MTLGIGAGQMNRVGAAKIALEQAGEKAKGAALASDAFFPMDDTVEAAAKAGITAIIQPGARFVMRIRLKRQMNMELRWYLPELDISNINTSDEGRLT